MNSIIRVDAPIPDMVPSWVKWVSTLGLGTVLAMYLVHNLVATNERKLDAILTSQARQAQELKQFEGSLNAHIDATGKANAEMLFYLREQCIILAIANAQSPSRCSWKLP